MIKKPQPKFNGEFKIHPTTKRLSLVLYNKDFYQRYIDQNFKPGQTGSIIVKRFHKNRTTGKDKGTDSEESNQNGYYWGQVIPILADYFGYLPYEMHEALKNKFLRKGNPKDPRLFIAGSTAELNTKEWEDLMETIRVWAKTEYNVHIPEPNEADSD